MRVLFISHYFFPEGNAPATRVHEFTRRWVQAGHQVTVITGVPNVPNGVPYEGYTNRFLQRERVDGVDVIRVWTWLAANKGTVRRILNYVSFMVTAFFAGLFAPRPALVIATSPQFFCGWAGVGVAWARRLPFVLEVRDLWPESIAAVGAFRSQRLLRALEWLERRMYAAADVVVTVGDGYRRKLEERGVTVERIWVLPNGVDLSSFEPREDDGRIRADYGLGDRFVCAYIGTIGMGCGLEVVLEAARLLRSQGRDDVRFLLVGDGAVRDQLEARARDEGLDAVVFTGRQPKARMPEFLATANACLVHLTKTDLFRTVMPSKIFEAAAMHRPIVLGVEGFAADLVEKAGAGICIEPENAEQLLAAVDRLGSDRELARRMGTSGFEHIARRHDFSILADRYLELLGTIDPGEPRGVKILNIVGARPNLMKIAPLMEAYEAAPGLDPLLVHTGQHYDANMSELFFRQLGIPEPDLNLEVGSASHAVQTAEIMKAFEPVVLEHRPDAVLVVGDVNSTIACGLVAVKLGVRLLHVEAGLRSFDREMPEEINRVLTDSISDLLFCTESSGVENLRREGIPDDKVHLVGNVMIDTLLRHREKADRSTALSDLGLEPGGYSILTLHRPANVDDPEVFGRLLDALEAIQSEIPILFPSHPRTVAKIRALGFNERLASMRGLRIVEPLGYLDFLKLMASARLVLTDSGGVQEETTILGVPCLTLRDNTERPITVQVGTNRLVGRDPARILDAYRDVVRAGSVVGEIPPLWDGHAAQRIVDVLVNAL